MELADITYSPPVVGAASSVVLCTLNGGQLILAAFLWVDVPSDAASTGTFTVTGDTSGVFSVLVSPSADLYGGANPNVAALLVLGRAQVVSVNETVTLVWTPGVTPGATRPRVRVQLLTEQIF